MTIDDVRRRLDQIREIKSDNETAHSDEDQLHQDVLRAIAQGDCADAKECAALALETLNIRFQRWCA